MTRPRRAARHRNPTPRRRAFSLIEVLIALLITATLLTATLTALDASFRAYRMTTESASTNVVSRLIVNRILTMIRAGEAFGPYPEDPLDIEQNPMTTSAIEFMTESDPAANTRTIVRLERRDRAGAISDEDFAELEAADYGDGVARYELWFVQNRIEADVIVETVEKPLVTHVQDLRFHLLFDRAGQLQRATVDITVLPNDFQGAVFGSALRPPPIRLVASVSPRRLQNLFD